MIALQHAAPLALPRLAAEIPFEYRVPGDSGLCAPLALALLEVPALPDNAFSLGPNALLADVFADLHERDLASRALTTWWTRIQRRYPTTHFKWTLLVSDLADIPDGPLHSPTEPGNHGWFCLNRDDKSPIPRFSLARATEKLEMRLEGFGQTVIALLYDALRHLPEHFSPVLAHNFAQWFHWSECENDEEMISLARENNEDPADLFTRSYFFQGMPHWVVDPERVASRDEIVRAAREGFEKDVVAACDAIVAFGARPDFDIDSSTLGTSTSGIDSVDGIVILVWEQFDRRGEVIDTYLEQLGSSGEYVDYIDMRHVPLTAQAVGDWMRRTEQMMQLSQLTERLIVLIGEPF